jgi:hypothetical protein
MKRIWWLPLAVLAVLAVALLARPSRGDAGSCTTLDRGVLPVWARTGFSDKRPKIAHVLGRHGRIVAILFGDLVAPATKDAGDKVLWAAKDPLKPLSDLQISAQRVVSGRRVGKLVHRTVVGGPGPSGIEMPVPGCWRMSLKWSGRTDELDLRYRSSASKGA